MRGNMQQQIQIFLRFWNTWNMQHKYFCYTIIQIPAAYFTLKYDKSEPHLMRSFSANGRLLFFPLELDFTKRALIWMK